MNIIIALLSGIIIGFGIAVLARVLKTKTAKEIAAELYVENEQTKKETLNAIINNVKSEFGNLSLQALSKSTEEFLKLAKERLAKELEIGEKDLDAKKGLIDQQLKNMSEELENVSKLMKSLEKDRSEKYGELTTQLDNTNKQTLSLMEITSNLREALANTKVRGQWGERMAEDVLKMAGFVENVNYLKQKSIKDVGSIPDFTFLLPKGLKVNMDVKFPLDNYIKYLETDNEPEKEKFRKDFLKDVKAKIKEVTSREYINTQQNTVDYVLLFIPNDQIYSFIYEQDSTILDEGIKNKVIFCSPITFFAVLAVIRQAVENFSLEQTSNEILSLLGGFKKQWDLFLKKMTGMGDKIQAAYKTYEELVTRRKNKLEVPLRKIEKIRTEKHLEIASGTDEEVLVEDDNAGKEQDND